MEKIARELTKIAKLLIGGPYQKTWWDIQRENQRSYWRDAARDVVFVFRNKAMEDLWNDELAGQISDGAWENTPGTGWEFWTAIKTRTGSKTQLMGNLPSGIKRGFGFHGLIPIIGDRMLDIIRKYEPDATVNTLRAYLSEIAEAMRKGEAIERGGTEPLPKDIKRIEDMVKRFGPKGPDAILKAAERMAKSIRDVEKAIRRGKAAEKLGYPELAVPFLERAKQLV